MNITDPIPTTFTEHELLLSLYSCIENSDDGFLIVDTAGRIAFINDAYCKYIDKSREEMLGQPVLNYIDTSELVEFAINPNLQPQIGVLHQVSAKQYRDGEHYCIVNRNNTSENGISIAGAGQIKFLRNTLKLSYAINNVYAELSYYKEELQRLSAERYSFQNILGDSEEMVQLKNMAFRTASNDFPVLITGETGTGKEVFASAIHYASPRKNKPFVRINCAAIPSELLESELFGYAGGAFTGSKKSGKKGKFELANGGTLFLDEIGDMPLVMQAKILRALQEKEIEPVGSEKVIPVDVRIIAATNKDLEREISEKRFRSDLYFRLNVISIKLPAVRNHPSDIDLYINAFLTDLNEKYHTEVIITPRARKQLNQYSWPGNIREIKNIVERCYALQEDGIISSITLPQNILKAGSGNYPFKQENQRLETIMNHIEREVLIAAIQLHNGNLRATAAALGIHRVTLYKKMEKLDIHREDISSIS